MKRVLVLLTTVVAIAAVAVGAAFAGSKLATRTIYQGQGIRCDLKGQNVLCIKTGGANGDYGVGFSKSAVLVMRFDADGSSHVVFKRFQP